jgi:release factor glutamine methyltransferase
MTETVPSPDGVWTIARLLSWTRGYLERHAVADPRLSGEVLLAHSLGCRRIDLYARFDSVPPADVLERFRGLVRRGARHEPVAYLVGIKEFYSLAFRVTPAVLIPRPETETLVECVLDHCAKTGYEAPSILDLGTGSGCIAVALLHQIPEARAVAGDISADALTIARENAERHGVAERCVFVEADRLDLPGEVLPPGGFDVIVSNPPYIAAAEVPALEPAVRNFEPMIALSDQGDGLCLHRSIAAGAAGLLAPGGVVAVEVAAGQASRVAELFEGCGWRRRETRRDRVAGHERVLVFEPPRGV